MIGTFKLPIAEPPESTGDYLVRFIDYDGTILKEQYVNSGQAATAPNTPIHDLLTFDEWNNDFSNITSDLDVGATYRTTTGHSYLFLSLTVPHLLTPSLYLNKSSADVLDVYDNTSGVLLGTTSASGNVTINLTFVAVGDYVIRIECSGNYTFQSALFAYTIMKAAITAVYIGDRFIDYKTNIFKECKNLQLIMLPKTTLIFGTGIFYLCSSLKGVIIPNNVSILGEMMFYQCYSAENIVIPSSTELKTQYLYGYCYNLSTVICANINSNNSNLYYQCTRLKKVILPTNLSTIGYGMFYNCSALESITIPDSVNSIAISSFQGCSCLQYIRIPDAISILNNYTFSGCASLKSIEIPINVSSIGIQCFSGCASLKSIEIPINISSIGSLCFNGCILMQEYIFEPTTPPTLASTNVFANIQSVCKIYVPNASVDAYKAATNWATYASYIYPISSRPS